MNIPISKEGGLEPHLTFCLRCGGDGDELTIGVLKKAQLDNGQWLYANRGEVKRAERSVIKQGYKGHISPWQPVLECEKVPASQPCKSCQEEIIAISEVVEAGGVFLRCAECGLQGALRPENELAKDVRKESGIMAPDPVGYEHEGCSKGNMILPHCGGQCGSTDSKEKTTH